MSSRRTYKSVLVSLAIVLLVVSSLLRNDLNRTRLRLGLGKETAQLENASPVLAFTTVALGGFSGLIANALWIRAYDLEEEGKYFEAIQLSEWITKLQPQLAPVWVHLAWNLVYNISIKFQDPVDRWRWIQAGIRLLRDEGLPLNPDEPTIYRELAWFYQHKIGYFLDDAHLFYKEAWAQEMNQVLKTGHPNFEELINPKTDEARETARILREKYKLDPRIMKEVDDHYGPLEWRLPEAHAIYWAWLGLKKAVDKPDELLQLRRVIYQSMQMAFQRGRLIEAKFGKAFLFGANLDIIPKVNQAYEDMMQQDPENRQHIQRGHRNFLRDAVYFLYSYDRRAEAERWFKYLGEKYPNDPLIMGNLNSKPGMMSLDDYALSRIGEDANETSPDRVKAVLEGLVTQSFYYLAIGVEERAVNYDRLAKKIRQLYQSKISGQEIRVGLPEIPELKKEVLNQVLGEKSEWSPELQARLRTELGLPAPTNAPVTVPPAPAPASTTNAPVTNAPAKVSRP
jgi:hypothetical protein